MESNSWSHVASHAVQTLSLRVMSEYLWQLRAVIPALGNLFQCLIAVFKYIHMYINTLNLYYAELIYFEKR